MHITYMKIKEKRKIERGIKKGNLCVKKFVIHIRNLEAEKFRSHLGKC